MLLKTSDSIEDVLDVSSESLTKLKEEATLIDMDVLMRYIRIFSELSNQVKYSSQKRVMIEIAFIKLCKPAMETNLDSVLDRISTIEKQLENGIQIKREASSIEEQPREKGKDSVKASVPLPKAISEDVKLVVSKWNSIIDGTSGRIKPYLKAAKLSVGNENKLLVVFSDSMADNMVNTPERKQELEQCIANSIGKQVEVDMKMLETGVSFEETYVDIQKVINMDIIIED